MNGYRNPLAGPAPQSQQDMDWTRRLMQQMPFNPYAGMGGQDFRDDIFVVPQAPANSLSFDRNAISPEWLDPTGRMFQSPGPRPLKVR